MGDKTRRILVALIICIAATISSCTTPTDLSIVGMKTCDLPDGSEMWNGMPVRSNKNCYITTLLQNKQKNLICLVRVDKSNNRCSRKEIVFSGTIEAVLPIDAYLKSNAIYEIDCRWKEKKQARANDHLVGIIKAQHHEGDYVQPEYAWLVDMQKLKFMLVSSTDVECFDGRYD